MGRPNDVNDLVFRVLGPVHVLRNGQPVAVVGRKPLALLSGLLLSANAVVPVSAMIDWVWGENLPAHPQAALHNLVSRLRCQLGRELITVTPAGYQLATDMEHLDWLEFEHLVAMASGRVREGKPKEAAFHFAQALGLWREPLLGNVDSPALCRDAAGRLTERYLDTHYRYARLCLELGWHASVVEQLSEPVRAHPFREPLVGQLMLALLHCGRRADALSAYNGLRRALRDELGIDPSPELQTIHIKILRSGPERQQVSLHATAPRTARPWEMTTARELPTIPSRLYGRDDELRRLGRWLTARDHAHPGAGLAAIVGPAGVGKSALAVCVAVQAGGQFPDGRLYVNLRGHEDGPLEVSTALLLLLSSLRMDPEAIPGDERVRGALYRSLAAGRRMLVVLDNVRDADQVRPLLPGAESGGTTIVTSRDQLRGLVARESAHRIVLDGICAGAGHALLSDLAALPPDTPYHVVAGLVERCGGLPLALRIIAERLARGSHSPREVLREFHAQDRPLDVFDSDESISLRNALSGSYRTLDAGAARAYRRLSGHADPILSLNAAAALLGCSAADSRRLLDRLVNVCLLGQRGPDAYWFSDLIRAHARECAEGSEPVTLTG